MKIKIFDQPSTGFSVPSLEEKINEFIKKEIEEKDNEFKGLVFEIGQYGLTVVVMYDKKEEKEPIPVEIVNIVETKEYEGKLSD